MKDARVARDICLTALFRFPRKRALGTYGQRGSSPVLRQAPRFAEEDHCEGGACAIAKAEGALYCDLPRQQDARREEDGRPPLQAWSPGAGARGPCGASGDSGARRRAATRAGARRSGESRRTAAPGPREMVTVCGLLRRPVSRGNPSLRLEYGPGRPVRRAEGAPLNLVRLNSAMDALRVRRQVGLDTVGPFVEAKRDCHQRCVARWPSTVPGSPQSPVVFAAIVTQSSLNGKL